SRRRHTRFSRDWSSDVCSSDLFSATKFREGYDVEEVDDFLDEVVRTLNSVQEENEDLKSKLAAAERRIAELSRADASSAAVQARSEERRVGKERRQEYVHYEEQ